MEELKNRTIGFNRRHAGRSILTKNLEFLAQKVVVGKVSIDGTLADQFLPYPKE